MNDKNEMSQLPEQFIREMKKLLQDELPAFEESYTEHSRAGLRINLLKTDPEEFASKTPFSLTKIPWITNGFYYEREDIPAKHPLYHAGLYYIQEPSAMTPAHLLPVAPGDKVLDLCAAPGGKATELGARLMGKGILAANDISSSRSKALLKNLEMHGIGNAFVMSEDSGKLKEQFYNYFDKILIDAPCSGEGMFRKDPSMVRSWLVKGPKAYVPVQKQLLLDAADMLSPGGMILYSTCTFSPLENEEVIGHLLSVRDDFQLIEVPDYSGFSPGRPDWMQEKKEEVAKAVRIFPHRMEGEGHFAALLQKKGNTAGYTSTKRLKKPVKLPDEFLNFLSYLSEPFDLSRMMIQKEKIYYLPEEEFPLTGIRFLRTGLYMGECKKNRFEPSQALAMYLNENSLDAVISFSLRDERAVRYLKGETVDISDYSSPVDKGWQLVMAEKWPLGWGKLQGTMLKNKYQPGWRWL